MLTLIGWMLWVGPHVYMTKSGFPLWGIPLVIATQILTCGSFADCCKALNLTWPAVYKTCSEISNYTLCLVMIISVFSTTSMAPFASSIVFNTSLKSGWFIVPHLCWMSSIVQSTVELHLSELIGTTSHPDMQKIRIIGFFFENRLHWQFEVEKKILRAAILVYVFIYVQIKQ